MGGLFFSLKYLPILALYGPPIVLFVALLYFEIRVRRMTRNPALNEEETEKLSELEVELKSVGWRLAEIDDEADRHNLKRNLDGSIYRGSKLGREFDELSERVEKLKIDAYALRNKPIAELNEWIRTVHFHFALRVSTAAYVVCALFSLQEHNFEAIALPGPPLPTMFWIAGLFAVSYAIHSGWTKLKTRSTRHALEEFANYEYAGEFFDLVEDERDENCEADEGADDANRGGQGDATSVNWTAARALEILGLNAGATEQDIREAHRRLIMGVHPDIGGSNYLSKEVNEARDVLIQALRARA